MVVDSFERTNAWTSRETDPGTTGAALLLLELDTAAPLNGSVNGENGADWIAILSVSVTISHSKTTKTDSMTVAAMR